MRLGDFHVLVSLTFADDGTATFLAHCPKTMREASVSVSASDETLASLIVEHGQNVIYHSDAYLHLEETGSRKFVLSWAPYVPVSTPRLRLRPAVVLAAAYLQPSIL